jgi:hypothetical protein
VTISLTVPYIPKIIKTIVNVNEMEEDKNEILPVSNL